MSIDLFSGHEIVGPAHVHVFEADGKSLFKTNNVSVFRDGLVDLSKSKNGLPLVASMPHFLYADADLVKLFKTKPIASAHNTFVSCN